MGWEYFFKCSKLEIQVFFFIIDTRSGRSLGCDNYIKLFYQPFSASANHLNFFHLRRPDVEIRHLHSTKAPHKIEKGDFHNIIHLVYQIIKWIFVIYNHTITTIQKVNKTKKRTHISTITKSLVQVWLGMASLV